MSRWLPVLLLCACHPLSLYDPPELPKKEPLVLAGNPALKAEVEIRVDGRGVPHLYAQSENDAAFGLGFMHARDRQFQLLLLKHAGQGRLTELFGEALLPVDRRLRLSVFGLEDQLSSLTPRDRALLEAYCAGVLAGAKQAGKTAEMALLGKTLDTFTPYDALSILRLQGWQLSQDFQDELVRELILSRLSPEDPRRKAFDQPAPSHFHIALEGEKLDPLALEVVQSLGLFEHGASNSWVVAGERTATGKPMLCNDPHLSHGLPGVFYLAQLTTPDFSVEGATLPGGPMVVIGFADKVAWGVTAAYADVQDVLRLQVPSDDDNVYLLDGERVPFKQLTQSYVLGRSKDAKVSSEVWKVSAFGPVIPQGLGGWNLTSGPYAFDWTAYAHDARNAHAISGWFDLAKAQTLDQASRAFQSAAFADVSVVLAMTDGTVAYRMEALAGERPAGMTGRVVRPGEHATDALQLVDPSKLPALDSAPNGFIVAANQRVVSDSDPRASVVGTAGVEPSRAERITERLNELSVGGQKPNLDQLISIQQDTVSPQARKLAPLLGAHCPASKDARLKDFCESVKKFDGDFKLDSRRALPFVALLQAVNDQVALQLVSAPEAELIARTPPLTQAVITALETNDSAFFGDLDQLVARAAVAALATVSKAAGDDPRAWRWGKVHRAEPHGPLASAPVLGGFFNLPSEEQAGWITAPRAEGPVPADHGAVLRFGVELTEPPRAKMVLDTGQSGVPRTEHFYDMRDDWNRGTPPWVPFTREDVAAATVAKVVLRP
jgi:penicillin amidase